MFSRNSSALRLRSAIRLVRRQQQLMRYRQQRSITIRVSQVESLTNATPPACIKYYQKRNFSAAPTGGRDVDVTTKFGDSSFWEEQYSSQSQQQPEPFEWFLSYEGGLREHLLPFLESMSSCRRLLHVGCGTSEVGPKLAAEAGLNLHVIDTDNSPSAVRLMQDRHQSLSCYACREMDALDLPFPDGRFGAVLDKGTLDALLCRSAEDAQALVMEMHRVLTDGGIYVQITTEDPEARLELLTGSVRGETAGWSKSFFKEISDSVGEITYFMYVLVK